MPNWQRNWWIALLELTFSSTLSGYKGGYSVLQMVLSGSENFQSDGVKMSRTGKLEGVDENGGSGSI